ncbi:MAG: hypothetical protein QNJ12_10200 [Ilumatobacter sp.]|uniref:hypothetical protein n=1 Tax=Ilumatobacter sp. TaxID=1967498 RepID=UPI00262075B8|nr:hypothetical protein [Ilumatobacter sp.]MDJ0769158.1 hypothetical protein [Ilumatobacter sp.]
MRAVTLERTTRRLVAQWTAASMLLTATALAVTLAAGGNSEWTRWLLGIVSMAGLAGATRYRLSLHVGVAAGVLMLSVVPHDATLDRGVVAAIGAVLVLLAAEAASVARRLVTIAPIRSTRHDAIALASLTVISVVGVTVVAAVAQLDRWGSRVFVIGLAITAAALTALLRRPASTSA